MALTFLETLLGFYSKWSSTARSKKQKINKKTYSLQQTFKHHSNGKIFFNFNHFSMRRVPGSIPKGGKKIFLSCIIISDAQA